MRSLFSRRSATRSGRDFIGLALGAFSLVELLVVVALIAILAGLALGTLGYVNRKGAESRARAEVAALSAAIEAFKLDMGAYPSNSVALYSNLCASGGGSSNAKVYFEPTPQILVTNGAVVRFADPWGALYEYANRTNYFELWSTGGGTNEMNFIRN